MKAEYDLSKLRSRRNPYAARLKKPVSMRLSEDVVDYFKSMAKESGVPYQSLINLYLRDCVTQQRNGLMLQIKVALEQFAHILADPEPAERLKVGQPVKEKDAFGQHVGMSAAACHIFFRHPPVDIQRGVDLFHDGRRCRGKSPAPHHLAFVIRHCHILVSVSDASEGPIP